MAFLASLFLLSSSCAALCSSFRSCACTQPTNGNVRFRHYNVTCTYKHTTHLSLQVQLSLQFLGVVEFPNTALVKCSTPDTECQSRGSNQSVNTHQKIPNTLVIHYACYDRRDIRDMRSSTRETRRTVEWAQKKDKRQEKTNLPSALSSNRTPRGINERSLTSSDTRRICSTDSGPVRPAQAVSSFSK